MEPLCDWLDGLGSAAQARVDGRPAEAHLSARRARSARPAGDAAARADLELALSPDGSTPIDDRLRSLRSALAAAPPVTRGAIHATLGEALLERGEPQAAVESFRAAAAEGASAVSAHARSRVAEALHAGGLAAEAVSAWRPLLADPLATNLKPSARLAFATDLRAVGDPRRAAVILRSIWSDLPERAEAGAAEALLSSWRGEGDAVASFSGEERIARALRLAAVGRGTEAVAELERASACNSPPAAGPLALAKGTVLLALGRPAEAEALVSPHARSPDAGVRRGAQLVLARAAARQRRFADAIAAWSAVAASRADVPGLTPQAQASLRDDAEYFAAWLHFDTGELERAADALGRLARKRPRSRRAEDARWFSAWALVRLNEASRADAALRALEDGPSAARVRYWRARIAADEATAGALLRGVVERDPLGYYGLLSCARLRGMGLDCAPPSLRDGQPVPELDTQPSAARLRQASALASAGLRDEALAELAAIASSNGRRRVAPLVAELAAFLGDPLLPFRLTRDQIGLSRRTLAWGFPNAWDALIVPAARSAGVDPALVRAVMRRESGYRQEIRSAAGAVGLLQIVPGTATRLASLLRLPDPIDDRLGDPAVNVPLGVGYLALLLERFREPLVAVAAYNAGPGAIERWTLDREVPLDAWVESIPFRETRQYVRAVVENWAGARVAAGEPLPLIDPDRPVAAPPAGVMF